MQGITSLVSLASFTLPLITKSPLSINLFAPLSLVSSLSNILTVLKQYPYFKASRHTRLVYNHLSSFPPQSSHSQYPIMSLVSGPGRGGASSGDVPNELRLVVEKHVEYIKSLDTVCFVESSKHGAEAHSLTAAR